MSTTAMWLLLAVVVIVILFASVLYKRTFTTKELALTGVMAALSLVAYLFFRVPFYGGSSFHLGNTFTALTALLLDGVSGGYAPIIRRTDTMKIPRTKFFYGVSLAECPDWRKVLWSI